MGGCIDEITVQMFYLRDVYSKMDKTNQSELDENVKTNRKLLLSIIKLQMTMLYTIILQATFFRNDFRSLLPVEKKFNLKNTTYMTSELFKVMFVSKRNLWNPVKCSLLSNRNTEIRQAVENIEKAIKTYNTTFYKNDRDARNISVHYDNDMKVLYDFLCNIDEEEQSKRLCSLLAIIQPLTFLANIILGHFKNSYVIDNYTTYLIYENVFGNFTEDIYNAVGHTMESFANSLDSIMKWYNYELWLPKQFIESLGNKGTMDINKKIHDATLGVFLYYIYIDVATCLRAFLSSEKPVEQRINLIRLNTITFEAIKKICNPKYPKQSFWYINVYSKIQDISDDSLQERVEVLNTDLQNFGDDAFYENGAKRHLFVHNSDILEIADKILALNSKSIIIKSKSLLDILHQILLVQKQVLTFISDREVKERINRLLKPIYELKDKILTSNSNEEVKADAINTLNQCEADITKLFE